MKLLKTLFSVGAVSAISIGFLSSFAELPSSKATAKEPEFNGPCGGPLFELYQYGDGGGRIFSPCSGRNGSAFSSLRNIDDGGWNDRASSIRTNGRPVSLYSDSKFQGSCIVVTTRPSIDGKFNSPLAFNLSEVGFDDVVSSVRFGRDSRCTDVTASRFTGSLANLISGIKSGNMFTVTFDQVGNKFDDSGWTGNTDPMGTAKAGETYQITYSGGKFTTRGFNEGNNSVISATYGNANPDENKISLWGRVYTFDANGNVYDPQFGLVGTLRF